MPLVIALMLRLVEAARAATEDGTHTATGQLLTSAA
jgi:hypothetical protein